MLCSARALRERLAGMSLVSERRSRREGIGEKVLSNCAKIATVGLGVSDFVYRIFV